MSSESDPQQPLQPERGMLVLMAVVLVVSWFGAGSHRLGIRHGHDSGHAFGSWTKPKVMPVLEKTVESQQLGIRIDAVEGFAFFLVDHPEDGQGPATISLINREDAILGEIKTFDPVTDHWPPRAIDFGQTVNVRPARDEPTRGDIAGDDSVDPTRLEIGPVSDFRLQVQTMLYGDTEIVWASPRKSPAWPLRVHRGKCAIGDRELLISIYELSAKSTEPDYRQGPIAAIATALSPL